MIWVGTDGSQFVCLYDEREEKIDQLTPDEARMLAVKLTSWASLVENANLKRNENTE